MALFNLPFKNIRVYINIRHQPFHVPNIYRNMLSLPFSVDSTHFTATNLTIPIKAFFPQALGYGSAEKDRGEILNGKNDMHLNQQTRIETYLEGPMLCEGNRLSFKFKRD